MISKHFSRVEFACKCGCGLDTVDVETLMVAEVVREYVGVPVTIGSGCRCPSHNNLVGGAKHSQHKYCRAADLYVDNPRDVIEFLMREYPHKYGFGLYSWGVHVDTRTGPLARWNL